MIGNILALTNSASNENIEVDGLLKKGLYNGTASDLKEDIDKKVSQEVGKGLSSNDYTDDEKQKNDENANKRIVGFTVTGDVNKIITITFADSTVMQAPFKDNDHIPLADVNMNSLNFNGNTGVLTGVKSDGNEISVSLEGRYSLIGHNHDKQYSPKTHTHSEYAPSSHRHNLGDIDGMPNDLATTENIKAAIDAIQIGGRNYVLDSKTSRSRRGEYIEYKLSKTLERGKYIASVDVSITKDTGFLGIIPAIIGKNSTYPIVSVPTQGNKRYFFEIEITGDDVNAITLYPQKQYVASTSPSAGEATFSNFKLEKGNRATDWTPAPEDLMLWEKQNTKEYGEVLVSEKPILTKEVFLEHQSGSKASLWTVDNELNVSSRKTGSWSKINCAGYKKIGSSREHFLTGDGGHEHRKFLGRCGEIRENWTLTQSWIGQTINVLSQCNVNLIPLENNFNISFRKCFAGGQVTFTTTGRTVVFTGDNTFNGGDGSTCVVSAANNKLYIDIRNV